MRDQNTYELGSQENIDSYDVLLDILGYKNHMITIPESEMIRHFDAVCQLVHDLGISTSGFECDLLLWNDHVNEMMQIVLALCEACKLDNEDSMRVMMDAHNNGKSVIKKGVIEDLFQMAMELRSKNIGASLQMSNPPGENASRENHSQTG